MANYEIKIVLDTLSVLKYSSNRIEMRKFLVGTDNYCLSFSELKPLFDKHGYEDVMDAVEGILEFYEEEDKKFLDEIELRKSESNG